MRVALIKNSKVINIVDVPEGWNGTSGWQPPAEHSTVITDAARVGDNYDGTTFSTPPPPERDREKAITDSLPDPRELLKLLYVAVDTNTPLKDSEFYSKIKAVYDAAPTKTTSR